MSWIVFVVGVMVGAAMGVLVVALCQMASGEKYPLIMGQIPKIRNDVLGGDLLVGMTTDGGEAP